MATRYCGMISPGTVSGRASLTCLHFVNERQHWNSTNRRGHFARRPGVVAETVVEVGGGAGFFGGGDHGFRWRWRDGGGVPFYRVVAGCPRKSTGSLQA